MGSSASKTLPKNNARGSRNYPSKKSGSRKVSETSQTRLNKTSKLSSNTNRSNSILHTRSNSNSHSNTTLKGSIKKAANIIKRLKVAVSNLDLNNPLNEPVDELLASIHAIFYEISNLKNDEYFSKAGVVISQDHFLNFCCNVWDDCHSKQQSDDEYFLNSTTYKMVKTIVWNYSNNCQELCEKFYNQKVYLLKLMSEFTIKELDVQALKNKRERYIVKATLGILHNALRKYEPNKQLVRENNGINNLHKYYSSSFLIIKAKIMILLAYCVNEEENQRLTTDEGVVAFILKLLRSSLDSDNHVARSYAFSASETVSAIDRLCLNDTNKVSIVEQEGLVLLMKMINESITEEEREVALHCIWTLSFHEKNKIKIEEEVGLMDYVQKTLRASDKKSSSLIRSCNGIYFNIYGTSFNQLDAVTEVEPNKTSHIMISYQWDVQPTMKKLAVMLKSSGYNVWIDVQNMEGSILAAMANAVEQAKVVVVAMSEKYKNSNNCRTEAEYAYKLKKPIVPLLLERNYKPDGWLGALLGLSLYVDISVSYSIDTKYVEIVKQIDSYKPITNKEANVNFSLPPPSFQDSFNAAYKKWSQEEVIVWAENTRIDGLAKALYGFDGEILETLIESMDRSPEFFFKSVKEDLQLSFINCLKFVKKLKQLQFE